jgi:hypothetical protein
VLYSIEPPINCWPSLPFEEDAEDVSTLVSSVNTMGAEIFEKLYFAAVKELKGSTKFPQIG